MTVIKLVQGRDGVFMTPEEARQEAWDRLAEVMARTQVSMSSMRDSSYSARLRFNSFAAQYQRDAVIGMQVHRPQNLAGIIGIGGV